MRVLAVNAGSSSLRLTLVDEQNAVVAARRLQAPGSRVDADELERALDSEIAHADAVGHRIVHGGDRYRHAISIDAGVRQALGALVDLAPLHQPKSLAALDAVSHALPGLPAVACFDTAFHTTLSPAASTYALPERWRERWGLRRYGFHGLSHAWVARRAPELVEREPAGLRIVSAHLGAGASLCAIRDGLSRETTMGFTPLEGLVMATRSGSVDPGLLLWLLEHEGCSPGELTDALEHRSGLLGIAGTAEMQEVTKRAGEADTSARLALDVYVHRLGAGVAAMAAAIDGLDVLVFTGGVGEGSPEVRRRAADALGFLGVALDDARNRDPREDADVSTEDAKVRTLVLAAREDLEIARQTRAALSGERATPM